MVEHVSFKIGDTNLIPTKIEGTVSKFDITLMVDSEEDDYILYWEYNCDIFFRMYHQANERTLSYSTK